MNDKRNIMKNNIFWNILYLLWASGEKWKSLLLMFALWKICFSKIIYLPGQGVFLAWTEFLRSMEELTRKILPVKIKQCF